jgi:hypothetical protein
VVVHRCPFCREKLGGAEAAVVSCAACNARHHTACWDEHRACASCQHTARLVPERPVEAPAPTPTRAAPSWGAMLAWLLAGGLLALMAGGGLIYANHAREQRLLALEAEARAQEAQVQAERARQVLGVRLEQGPEGPVVLDVVPGSRAAEAGVRAGDTLLALIEWSPDALDVVEAITSPSQLADLLERHGPRALLDLRVRRDGEDVRLRLR